MSSRWYPIYQKGNPQLRVFLPNFWMKMVKPDYNQYGASTPSNKVTVIFKCTKLSLKLQAQFIVSSQMTKHDVKNYLEKIYQVNRNKRGPWQNYSQSLPGGCGRCEDIEQDGENFSCEKLVFLMVELERCYYITKYMWPGFTWCWIR